MFPPPCLIVVGVLPIQSPNLKQCGNCLSGVLVGTGTSILPCSHSCLSQLIFAFFSLFHCRLLFSAMPIVCFLSLFSSARERALIVNFPWAKSLLCDHGWICRRGVCNGNKKDMQLHARQLQETYSHAYGPSAMVCIL